MVSGQRKYRLPTYGGLIVAERVLKDFKTVNRVFKPGDEVGPEDIQGYVSFEQWQARGFISDSVVVPIHAEPAHEPDHEDASH